MNTQAISKEQVTRALLVGLGIVYAVLFYPLIFTIFSSQRTYAAYSGLNGRIVFQSDRDGDLEIYAMKSDGTDIMQLTSNNHADEHPSWSPDGRRIVFTSNRDGNQEIYTMNHDGTDQARITYNVASDSRARYSPDGQKMVFESDRDGDLEVYSMNSDGNSQTRLTNDSSIDANAKWSPDGTRIAFASNRDGDNEIFIMDTSGNDVINLTNNALNDSSPDWSPDGSYLIFQTRTGSNRAIGRVGVNGTGFTELTGTFPNLANPVYYPDGSGIIFHNSSDGDHDLYVSDANGLNIIKLTDDSHNNTQPSFQSLTISPSTINTAVQIDASQGSVVYDALLNHSDSYQTLDVDSIQILTQPTKGKVVIDGTSGHITYSPYSDTSGSDSFTYQICSTAHEDLCTSVTVGVVLGESVLVETGTQNNILINLGAGVAILVSLLTFISHSKKFICAE